MKGVIYVEDLEGVTDEDIAGEFWSKRDNCDLVIVSTHVGLVEASTSLNLG